MDTIGLIQNARAHGISAHVVCTYLVIHQLAQREGELLVCRRRQAEIAALVGVSRNQVASNHLPALRRAGWITSPTGQTKARRILVLGPLASQLDPVCPV